MPNADAKAFFDSQALANPLRITYVKLQATLRQYYGNWQDAGSTDDRNSGAALDARGSQGAN